MHINRAFTPTAQTDEDKRAEMAQELSLSAIADHNAAERYRELAARNPSLKRDYLRRADLCDLIHRAKLAVLEDLATTAKVAQSKQEAQ